MDNMNVKRTSPLEELIRSKMALGLHTSAIEAVGEALHPIDEGRRDASERCVDRLDEQPGLLATRPWMVVREANWRLVWAAFRFGAASSSACRSKTGSTWCGCWTVLTTASRPSAKAGRHAG